jgi:hypothetical protein
VGSLFRDHVHASEWRFGLRLSPAQQHRSHGRIAVPLLKAPPRAVCGLCFCTSPRSGPRSSIKPRLLRASSRRKADGSKSACYDKTWNWRWNIGDRLLLVTRCTDHQRDGPQSSRSPDRLASSERARSSGMLPQRLRSLRPPAICLRSSGWMASAQLLRA